MFDLLHIVIPVYNEGENIERTLSQIESKITAPHIILIVYDFDEDNTLPIVNEIARSRDSKNILLVKNIFGRGVLNAIRTGFDSVKEGVVLVVMADSSDDFSIVDSMFKEINQGYDIVCGSRYMKGGKQIGGPRLKKLLSMMIGMSLHFLTNIPTHDVTNSFKMYRKSVLDNVEIQSNGGFEIGMEIVVKGFFKGYKIAEIPSTWQHRVAGKSNFRLLEWAPGYLRWYLYAVGGRAKNMLAPK